jgi:alpha/beta superfamily hydrolase
MQTVNTAAHRWIAGFSFGARIGTQLLMRRSGIEGYISIAPPEPESVLGQVLA